MAGLWLVKKLLDRHFTAGVTLAALVCLTFGTNVFHYLTYDAGYSHAYAFFLIAALLGLTEQFYDAPTRRTSALLGLVMGLLVLTRHSHAMLALFPLAHGLGVTTSFASRVAFLRRHVRDVLLTLAVAAAVMLPQFALYRAVTGSWFVTGYALLGHVLDLRHPQWFGVLFSPAKGLFFWSPILLLALAGCLVMPRGARRHLPALGVAFPLLTWLVASWYSWQFGGSYGHRAFTDLLPALALPLASALAWLSQGPRPVRITAVVVITVMVGIASVQMCQYWLGLIPQNDTTWEQYRALFLRLS